MRARHVWSAHEEQLLRVYYADTPTEGIAVALGLAVHSVYRKANQMGLHKTAAFRSAMRWVQGFEAMRRTQFQKGHTPATKGRRMPTRGRSGETQFRAGHKPYNAVEVGALRVCANSGCPLLQRKVTDTGHPRDWKSVHRLLWEATYGPTPAGHIVVFKPGRKSLVLEEITLDAIECITLKENMARNTVHARLPPELRRVVQLRGAITRQIRKKEALLHE